MPPTETRRGVNLGTIDWRQGLGGIFILVGFAIIIVAWVGASGTNDSSSQFSYAISGGLGGGACVIVGAMLMIAFEHHLDRSTLLRLHQRLDQLESGLAGEFDHIQESINDLVTPTGVLDSPAPDGPATRRSRTR